MTVLEDHTFKLVFLVLIGVSIVLIGGVILGFEASPERSIPFQCEDVNNTKTIHRKHYFNREHVINETMHRLDRSRKETKELLDRLYPIREIDRLRGIKRDRVQTAINLTHQYPNRTRRINVSRETALSLKRIFVRSPKGVFFCSSGYTGGA